MKFGTNILTSMAVWTPYFIISLPH